MCGIAGFWQKEAAYGQIEAMLNSIQHRGPDDQGQWFNANRQICLGQQRLSIIDLSSGGHQPMLSETGRVAITFNGEIYNFKELRQELEKSGIDFHTGSDTEVLLKGYLYWGTEVLDRLVGMFAFAIWDEDKEQLFLARDRAGEKPLYYAQKGEQFAFASEIQALTKLAWVDTAIDHEGLLMYLRLQAIPAPYSIYQGVKKLAPAHAMLVTKKGLKTWRYWDPINYLKQKPLAISEADAIEQLELLLKQAVKGQMIADVPLGAFLSGGIDSSTVVSFMTELASGGVKTFTIGFQEDSQDESKHAGKIAEFLGTDHTCEYLTQQDSLNLINRIPEIYGEPFGDPSALPTYLVSQVARKHVTVSLSGDGGDEAFGGYERYDLLDRAEPWIKTLAPFGGAMRSAERFLPRKAALLAPYVGKDISKLYQQYAGRFNNEELIDLMGSYLEPSEFRRSWDLKGFSSRRRAMMTDMLIYMPDVVLAKVDRAAMAVSLESRAPLLDHRILEFALRLPEPLIKDKYILKQLLYKRIPRDMLERPKQGFGVPLRKWISDDLKDLLIDTVTPETLKSLGISNTKMVTDLISGQLKGHVFKEYQLWTLLVLCMWYKGQKA